MVNDLQKRVEALGPAETVLNTLTQFMDHAVHNRPGMVSPDPRNPTGVAWQPVTWKLEAPAGASADASKTLKNVYSLTKTTVGGKAKTTKTLIGILRDDGKILSGQKVIGEYRSPGLFPEVVTWMYRQVANVWKMDNEFAARWASWSFGKEQRDLKVVLAAFLLVQSRSGEPVVEGGEILFHDDDFRSVGEAMCLSRSADKNAKTDLSPKLILRIGEVLTLPGVAEINRELGFGKSARNPAMGRYQKAVEKWLRFREQNPKMLAGLVKAGFRTSVMEMAAKIHYKPLTDEFYQILRWKQKQAKDGRRTMSIGAEVSVAESWDGMTETQVCEKIAKDKPNYKRIVGLIPKSVGLTRAVLACAIESGCLSNADLIILTPTLEEFGLLQVASITDKWKKACDSATNQRAANIAKNVKTKEAREGLQDAADKAMVAAVEEVTRDLRIYLTVDISGSMDRALERAVGCLTQFLGGFPLDRLHVSVFNTEGRVIEIKAPKAAAVQHAFSSYRAGGGTSYAMGIRALAKYKPLPGEDSIIWFIGDEEDYNTAGLVKSVQDSGINPVGFGLLHIAGGPQSHGNGTIVRDAARQLGIPCFTMDEAMFKDVYAVPRTIRNLIASTPVGSSPTASVARQNRKTLVQEILETPLLQLPLAFQVKAA